MNEFYVDNSKIHGRGCFARTFIKAGDRFECSVLPVSKHEIKIDEGVCHHVFPFTREDSCVVLSEFTYCNSSENSNLEVVKINVRERLFTFEALVDIAPGTEVTIDY